MTKKIRIRFLAIASTTILFVFALIYGIMIFFFNSSFKSSVEDNLKQVSSTYFETGRIYPSSLIFSCGKNGDSYTIYEIVAGSNEYSLDEINTILSSLNDSPINVKSINNIFYTTTNVDNLTFVIALDKTSALERLHQEKIDLLVSLSVLYGVLVVVLYGVSYKILKPVEDSIEKQRQFVSDASHELKTPIAVISANADVLKSSVNNRYLDSIKNQTDRLGHLVGDLLTLSKIDEGSISLIKSEFNISKEIEKVVLPFEAFAFEKGKTFDLNIEQNISYFGDLESVKKITAILIDNAVKHSDKNSTIKINLSKDGNRTILSVFNNGSQVENTQSHRVFERFYRADESRSRESGGTGLGLAIAKSICDMNRWKISANSIKNESMTITVIM